MEPVEIKIMLLRAGKTMTALSRKFGCRREELSMCIRQVRIYPALRQKLAQEFGTTVEALFGNSKKRDKTA